MNNTLLKGLQVMEVLARRGQSMGVGELAVSVGLQPSCVHRLLQGLVEERYVRRTQRGMYAATLKLWEVGSCALMGDELRSNAASSMERLMEQTGLSVHLSVLDQNEVVYVHKVEGRFPVRSYTQISGRAPAHCVATGILSMP